MSTRKSFVAMIALVAGACAGSGAGRQPTSRRAVRSASVEPAPCGRPGACWSSLVDPSQEDRRVADAHRKIAAAQRSTSARLRQAEAEACVGLAADDRAVSPFAHREEIVSVWPLTRAVTGEPSSTQNLIPQGPVTLTVGAVVLFRAVPGMTEAWLQRVVDCHLARNAALHHVAPHMRDCPLVPRGVEARVSALGDGFAVSIRSTDLDAAREILRRALLLAPQTASVSPAP